jgi:hypothetical protein
MEVDRLEARQVFGLDLVERARQKVHDPLEDRRASEDEVAVARVVRVAGLVEVEDVHKASVAGAWSWYRGGAEKKAADGSFEPRAP